MIIFKLIREINFVDRTHDDIISEEYYSSYTKARTIAYEHVSSRGKTSKSATGVTRITPNCDDTIYVVSQLVKDCNNERGEYKSTIKLIEILDD